MVKCKSRVKCRLFIGQNSFYFDNSMYESGYVWYTCIFIIIIVEFFDKIVDIRIEGVLSKININISIYK